VIAPVANANGTSLMSFTASDGSLPSAAQTFTLNVNSVNDAPSIAAIGVQSTNEDNATTAIAFTISDVDGPTRTCNGTYLSYSSGTSSVVAATGAVTWGGTWPNCTAVIAPVANANGSSVISFSASDGSLPSAAQTFTLTVNAVNDAPTSIVGGDSSKTFDPTGPVTVLLGASTDSDVLTNAQTLSYVVTTSPTYGTLGTLPAVVGTGTADLTYTPNARVTAIDSFSYKVCDNYSPQACSAVTSVTLDLSLLWAQEAYIKAANAQTDDYFGYSVSISGDTLAVGAYKEDSNQTTITNGNTASTNDSASSSGAVYVYRRSGAIWSQEAYVKAANAEADDYFGYSVSISGDTLAVGAYGEGSNQNTITNGASASANNSLPFSGSVYLYRRSGSNWAQEAYVKAANVGQGDLFGRSVTLSGDTLAVGAMWEESNQTTITNGASASANNSLPLSGAVYVYRRNGSSWTQEAYVKAANAEANDRFGHFVALSGDTMAVGAPEEDSNQQAISNDSTANADNSVSQSGAVYVYRRAGTTWAQEAYIKAINAEENDKFGHFVALSGDTLAVGVPFEDSNQTTITNGDLASFNNSAVSSGAVYVYRRTGTIWERQAYVKASNAETGDEFGYSVSLSGDTLAVGARSEDSNQTSITNDATASSNNSTNSSGAVYVYRRTGTSWAPEAYVKAANAEANDYFGYSVSLSGDTLAVGAYYEDSNQTNITNGTAASADNSAADSGAVYVYRHIGRMFDPELRVTSRTSTSITFTWHSSLGTTTQVKVAPAVSGTGSPAANCSDAGAITLAAGTTTYTYSGLTVNTKYGFRFCAWDGTNASAGATIWADTALTAPTLTAANVTGLKPTLTGTCDTSATTHTATTTIGSVRSVTCTSGTLSVLVHLPAGSTNFNVTATSTLGGTTSTSSAVTFTRTAFTCPAGYVGVPGSGVAELGNSSATNGNASWWLDTSRDFCVMKYPAKNVSSVAASAAAGLPWVNITRDSSASTCAAVGANYRLISNTQWQTVARNAESVAANWSGNAVGSGVIARGHSDNSPANILENSTDNDPYFGTGNSGAAWNTLGVTPAAGTEQKRTQTLSNGDVVWDFGGNVYQWVSDNYADLGVNPTIPTGTDEFSNTSNFPTALPAINRLLFAPLGLYNSAQNIGTVYGYTGLVSRGLSFSTGTNAGLFAASLGGSSGGYNSDIGFRCVFLP